MQFSLKSIVCKFNMMRKASRSMSEIMLRLKSNSSSLIRPPNVVEWIRLRLLIRSVRIRRFGRLRNASFSISDILLIDRSKIAVLGLSKLSNIVRLIASKLCAVMITFNASSLTPAPEAGWDNLQSCKLFSLSSSRRSRHFSAAVNLSAEVLNVEKAKANTRKCEKNFILNSHKLYFEKYTSEEISLVLLELVLLENFCNVDSNSNG